MTIAEGRAVDDSATMDDPAWEALPQDGRAQAIEVIARAGEDRWRVGLGGRARSGRR